MRRQLLQRLILAITLFALIGGHRGVIQCVAWGKMIYERTTERGFEGAFASTFSGEEPCDICDALRESKREDKGTPAPLPTVKIELAPVVVHDFIPVSRPVLATYPEQNAALVSASPSPPTPPPPERA